MSTFHSRYPGARPFETDQQLIFKGRQADTAAVFQRIQLETLTVLYGKSGTGKSSLLNAGVIPKVKAGTDMLPVRVRFNAYREGAEYTPPATTARLSVRGSAAAHTTFLDRLIPDEETLWHDVKEHHIRHEGKTGLLLVIDQFEELFTYPPAEVQAFAEQLAEALFKAVPQRYWDLLQQRYAQGERPLNAQELALFQRKPALKVVLSIRSDRLHLLNRLDSALPVILKNLYELDALGPETARQAIIEPAAMPRTGLFDFNTDPFLYDPAAVEQIIHFLSHERSGEAGLAASQKIEATQLQIICAEVEARVRAGELRKVLPAHVSDLENIIEGYYEAQILKLEEAEQLPARRLIEEGLVFEEEERRLSLYEGQIFKAYHIQPDTLRKLVDAHLLRAEPSLAGGYTYELSHDALVAPVLKAKRLRLEEELREEEALRAQELAAQLAAEKAEIERKRRRALITAFVAGALVLAAVVGIIYAVLQRQKALEAIRDADEKTEIARKATEEAERQKQVAEEKTEAATAAEAKAKLSEEIADLKEKEAQTATEQALLRKKEAELASLLALEAIMEQQREDVLSLRYDLALTKLKRAADFATASGAAGRVMKDSVAYGLMETALFYYYGGSPDRAREPFGLAAQLLGKSPLAARADFDVELKLLDAGWAAFLQRRYFPHIQELPGGVFLMGRDSTIEENGGDGELPRHEVQLDSFGLAQTETTFWQWNLYIAAKGRDIQRYSPSWGIFGDNPAVILDWFDACEYANWLSEREGKKPFYEIDSSAGPESRNRWKVSLQPAGNGYRLPTEAEREYAARGGPGAPYYTYAGGNDLDTVAWWDGNSRIDGVQRTRPVRQKKPVIFPDGAELYDLSGNVWEWCWDAYDENYYEQFRTSAAVNPEGPKDWGIVRVLRGGSWINGQNSSRVSYRNWNDGDDRGSSIGFRLARHPH